MLIQGHTSQCANTWSAKSVCVFANIIEYYLLTAQCKGDAHSQAINREAETWSMSVITYIFRMTYPSSLMLSDRTAISGAISDMTVLTVN